MVCSVGVGVHLCYINTQTVPVSLTHLLLLILQQKKKMSGGVNSIEAVKKKIKVLQEQAEEAEERAERLQREVEKEKRTREEVYTPAQILGVGGSHLIL